VKLSEAIRLGAMMTKHEHYRNWRVNIRGELSTCAVYSALHAAGADVTKMKKYEFDERVYEYFPILKRKFNLIYCIADMIINKNDVDHMTREEIADWVEEQEQRFEQLDQPDQVDQDQPEAVCA
jgi:hypothetical protein